MDDTSPTIDTETFRRFQRGEEEAAMLIVDAFYRRVLGYLYVQTGNHDTADDLAQEVFLAAFEQRKAIRSEKTMRSWLFTLAMRKAARSKGARQTLPLAADPEGEEYISTGAQAIPWRSLQDAQAGEQLRIALDGLPSEDRELVSLRYFGGLSIKELSETLDMPMGSVGVKLGRSLDKLRKHLEKKGFTLGDLVS